MLVRLRASEASTFSDHVMRYRCVHCRYETTARAFAFARGAGLTTYGLDHRGAEARDDRHARAVAAQAALSIRIAPCPRCRRYDRKTMLEVYRVTLWACLAIVVAPVLLLAWGGQRWSAATIVGLALGAVPAMVFWKHRTSPVTSTSVRFDSRRS